MGEVVEMASKNTYKPTDGTSAFSQGANATAGDASCQGFRTEMSDFTNKHFKQLTKLRPEDTAGAAIGVFDINELRSYPRAQLTDLNCKDRLSNEFGLIGAALAQRVAEPYWEITQGRHVNKLYNQMRPAIPTFNEYKAASGF